MATEMEDGDNDLAEEGWKDDDFLSFGNASDEKSKPKREEQSTADETSPATTNLENALPPWMDQPTNFRRVPPLVALHNEIVGFCKLMAPMPEVRYVVCLAVVLLCVCGCVCVCELS